MFENLLSFWRGKDFLTQVLGDFKTMLDDTERMFHLVTDTLIRNKENAALKDQIYEVDQRVNKLQKEIRRRIIEHVTIQPGANTNLSLCLMSVVKDAERLGDYCKNLYEVIELLEEPIDQESFVKYFNGLDEEIGTLFGKTREAFLESNNTLAISSWEDKGKITKKCDAILEQIAHSDLASNRAVCYALTARYFKRIMAHLVNIATSVVLPLSDLDYYDEKREGGEKKPTEVK